MHDLLLVRRVIAEFAFPFFHAGVLQRDFHVGGRSPRAVRADQRFAVIVQSLVGLLADRSRRRQRVRALAHSRNGVPVARLAHVGAVLLLDEVGVPFKGGKALAQLFDSFDRSFLAAPLLGAGGGVIATGGKDSGHCDKRGKHFEGDSGHGQLLCKAFFC